MYVTGRLPLLVALGAVPVVLLSRGGRRRVGSRRRGGSLLCADRGARGCRGRAGSPRALTVERRLPRRVLLGQRVDAELRLRNTRTTARVRGRVRDAWQPTAGAPAERLRDRHPARRGADDRPSRCCPAGGASCAREFVVVRSDGPLRLAGRQARLDAPGALRVLPPFTARRHLPSRLARLRELDGNTSVQVRGQGTEFDSLREYVRGDDVRSIDWRATARSSTTMLRTWRPERDRHVVIVIDTGRTAAARVGDGVRLDAAMEAALLLAALATRAGDHTHLLMFDRVIRARVTRVDGPAPAARARRRDGARRAAADRHRLGCRVRPGARAHLAAVARRAAHRAGRRRRPRAGSSARCPALARRAHVLVGTVTDEHGSAARAARTPRTSTAPRPRARRHGMPPPSPRRSAAPAPRRSPPHPRTCRRASPTATSRSRRPGASERRRIAASAGRRCAA